MKVNYIRVIGLLVILAGILWFLLEGDPLWLGMPILGCGFIVIGGPIK